MLLASPGPKFLNTSSLKLLKPVVNSKPKRKTLNILMLAPETLNTREAEGVIQNTCKKLMVKQFMRIEKLNFRDRNVMNVISHFFEDGKGEFSKFNIVWIVLPFNQKGLYGDIKKMSMKSRTPKLTQMTVESTFSKKGFMSVCTKILLQMASKVGNALWLPLPPKLAGTKTMMMGIDTAADSVQKGNIVAFCANVAGDFTKFYSHYYLQEKNKESPEKTGIALTAAAKAFAQENGSLPEEIIIMRNGCADSQVSMALENEVK